MRQTQPSGLQISRPQRSAVSVCWLLPILSGAAIYALLALTGLERPALPGLAGACVCGLLLLFGKRKWIYPGVLALLVLSLLLLRGRFLDGFCQWYNGMGRIFTAESGRVLPALEASADNENIQLFACWLAAAIGASLVFLSHWGKETAAAATAMLCGGVSLILGRMIDPLPLLLAAVLLCAGRGRKHHLLPVGILTAAMVLSLIPGFYEWAGERSEAVQRTLHSHQYETKYTTLPEGRLEPLGQSDAPALIVIMEKPEVLYMRGFTAAEFGEDRWQPLDNQILSENQELLYWLNIREFDLRAQFEAAASVLETDQNTVTVQNVGSCSAYRYIPFTIRADERLVPENLTDTAKGTRYDSFTTVYGGAQKLPELLTLLQAEHSRYLQAEAAYRDFVKAHYLTIPEELAEKMQVYWEKAEGMDVQAAVKTVLETCYPDGIRYDPFYATAAVLTLRHFGIPARYAEGYITPLTTALTVELTGRHAACWAEVYQDGIGWIPMELTPGLDGERSQQEEQLLPPDTPEQTQPPETEPTKEPQPDGGDQVRIAQVLLKVAIVLTLGLLLLILLLLLRRSHILKKRQAILNQENIREAVTWSFADAVQILKRMGIHRGNGSLDVLAQPLRDRFGAELAEQFEAATRINARALFSSKLLTETERATVHGFRSCVLRQLQMNSNRLTRLWMKYILCRF